ncbi:MAG: Mu transposase C-terminal domain-containing protein, partial [Spirochaetaceae bacterium]|nr:Mu transposase C-terminal domain-containing protein [Spirochaetaceae bacterium]
ALNRRLWAYLEGEYHQNPHRGLDGDTPLQRWAAVGGEVRYPDASLDLDDLFLAEARRRVMNDRTLSLDGRLYEVDPLLVGQTVTVRYDPAAPPTRPLQVLHNGADAGVATILDAYANASVKRARPSRQIEPDTPADQPPPSPLALRDLHRRQQTD